jgi:hypothetical protein
MTASTDALGRLLDRSVQDGECWIWQGCTDLRYGRIGAFGRQWLTHRLAYTLLVADVPDHLQIDHLCRNRLCINPAHLEAVPQQVNLARGFGPWAINARKTHCKRGHEFAPDNTLIEQGTRKCRACKRSAATERRRAARAAA